MRIPLDSTLLPDRERKEALRWAAVTIADRDLLIERLNADLTAECSRTSCLEPEVNELAAIALVLLDGFDRAEPLVAQVRKSVAEWYSNSTPMADLADALAAYDAPRDE